jgi:hypothetical protein
MPAWVFLALIHSRVKVKLLLEPVLLNTNQNRRLRQYINQLVPILADQLFPDAFRLFFL